MFSWKNAYGNLPKDRFFLGKMLWIRWGSIILTGFIPCPRLF